MKDGFIKVAAISPEIKVADCDYNTESIISELKKAAEKGVKLAVFPELVITGASCGDLFNQSVLIENAFISIEKIRTFTARLKHEITTIIGTPLEINGSLYNACVVIYKGKFLGGFLLNNYSSNSDINRKYFTDIDTHEHFDTRIGTFGKNLVFRINNLFSFSTNHAQHVSVIIKPYAEAETIYSAETRINRFKQHSLDFGCSYIYAGAGSGESTTDMVFSGHCLIVENGRILTESKPFEYKQAITEIDIYNYKNENYKKTNSSSNNETIYIDFDMDLLQETVLTRTISKSPFIPQDIEHSYERILEIQAQALSKRLKHIGANKIVLGLSGGLDSTLALLVAVRTIDIMKGNRSDVLTVTMPCFGTSHRTKKNAEKLAAETGVSLKTIDITEAVTLHFKDIGHDIRNHNVVFENAQARERTQVLMDIANSENGLLLGTGDLSELVLGWATYNGDHMSMYGINSGIPKTLIREIVYYYAINSDNVKLKNVLLDILDTPISPELLPVNENGISTEMTQKTEDLVGPYELHDFFIYYALKLCFPPKKVLRLAKYAFSDSYSEDTILKWLKNFYKRFFSQQYKRSCMPDGVKIDTFSLSPRKGLDMPSDAVSALWLKELDD